MAAYLEYSYIPNIFTTTIRTGQAMSQVASSSLMFVGGKVCMYTKFHFDVGFMVDEGLAINIIANLAGALRLQWP